MAASSSSTPFFGIRDEDGNLNQLKQQRPPPLPLPSVTSSSAATVVAAGNPQAAVPAKKRRNLPGNPNPDAEVIALSPKTLMATNRFICEVCSKGFQREQNLQLHRRGHNLPWKLKQKSTKEVRRRVYLCPEPTCVHHDPSRALGDLTGIKKHFCRKHGEKKWKCDKCSKRYAVQSDWKAHSKTCGTREYRCDCGTLFSRRDSFITHRAFCDALAQESARLPAGLGGIGSHLYGSSNIGLGLSQVSSSHLSSLQQNQTHHPSHDLFSLSAGAGSNMSPTAQFDGLMSPSNPPSFRPPHPPSPAAFFLGSATSGHDFNGDDSQPHHSFLSQNKHFHGIMQLPDLQPNSNTSSSNLFHLGFFPNNGGTSSHAGSNQHAHLMMHDQFNSGDPGGEPPTHGLFSGGNLMNDHMTSGMQALFNTSVQSDHSVIPQMSATALLQKAAQMGATSSNSSGGGAGGGGASLLRGFGNSVANEQSLRSHVENDQNRLQDIMNSFANGNSGIFGEAQEEEGKFGKFNASLCNMDEAGYQQNGLTRDFLGVGSMMRNMGGGMPFDTSEMKSATSSRSFACATFPSVRREE